MTFLNLIWSLVLCLFPVGSVPVAVDPLASVSAQKTVHTPDEADCERMLALYDALPNGPEKDQLERRIDAVAGQRYATYSRLYWFRDIEAAKARARATGKPILSLRLLGRLDEDLSCANSRFFRVVLYANQDVSRFLRENFVLFWSSECPVPKVTIDMGDGRAIKTTIAGNSAHYVLDCDGRPLDVLPGLYSPVAFRRGLEAILPLARASPNLSDEARVQALLAFQQASLEAARSLWDSSGSAERVNVPRDPPILEAEALTISKAVAERALLATLEGGRLVRLHAVLARRLFEARLDASSRSLLERLGPTDWALEPRALTGASLEELINIFESEIARDTEKNERVLRPQALACFVENGKLRDFAGVNRLLYTSVFRMPPEDVWLGLEHPLLFSGVPNDGIQTR